MTTPTPPEFSARARAFLADWLSHSTCHRHQRRILSEHGDLILLRHEGHSEYCGRGSGTKWCGSYTVLIDMTSPPVGPWNSYKPIRKWEGRWNKAAAEEALELIRKHHIDNPGSIS